MSKKAVKVLAFLWPLIAFGGESADSVLLNGRIYTLDDSQPWASAVAIRDGRFVAVGDRSSVSSLVGPQTRVIDLGGRMAMPGIHDLHIHPLNGALTALYACNFPPDSSIEHILSRVKSCADQQPTGGWIRGGYFDTAFLERLPSNSREKLDAVTPNHKVILRSAGGHAAWVNSAALQASGIDRNTKDPGVGFIRRDPTTDEPTGLLFETAVSLVESRIPEYTPEQVVTALAALVRDLNRQGVTSIKDASVPANNLRVYLAAQQQGLLTLRVATALALRTEIGSIEDQVRAIDSRGQFRTSLINPDFVKIFVDGSAGARKAAFLEPYVNDPQRRSNYRGEFLVPREKLKEYLIRLDKAGVSVKMHCGGDAARRAALDAIQAARLANGDSGIPHEIAHPALLHPDDIPRFAALNAVADLTPVAWFPNSIIEQLTLSLGESRGRRLWQIRSLVEAGATAVYGSDWPTPGPNTNPWRAMEAMLTRRNPDTAPGEAYTADQAVDLPTAIRIFTRNGAYAMRHDDRVGSISVGKMADMIVLEQSLFDVDPESIDSTRVLLTIFNGKEVHRDPAFP
ncbi:MAG: amidohydrolase [Gammaproteobacteria bacterium]